MAGGTCSKSRRAESQAIFVFIHVEIKILQFRIRDEILIRMKLTRVHQQNAGSE